MSEEFSQSDILRDLVKKVRALPKPKRSIWNKLSGIVGWILTIAFLLGTPYWIKVILHYTPEIVVLIVGYALGYLLFAISIFTIIIGIYFSCLSFGVHIGHVEWKDR